MTQPKVVESDGFKWLAGGPTTDDHLSYQGHEAALLPLIQKYSDVNRCYVNVGAHVGTWALRGSVLASEVIAIEGNPATFETLRTNILMNGMKNIIAVQAVVWDTSEQIVRFVDVNNKETGGSTRFEVVTDKSIKPEDQGTTTLDELLRIDYNAWHHPVGLIIIDVEGAEARVLQGAQETLLRDRPTLIVELHEGHPGADKYLRRDVLDILGDCRYDVKSLHIAGDEEHLLCIPVENMATEEDLPWLEGKELYDAESESTTDSKLVSGAIELTE